VSGTIVIISVLTNGLTQIVLMLLESTLAEIIRAFITNAKQRIRFWWHSTPSFLFWNWFYAVQVCYFGFSVGCAGLKLETKLLYWNKRFRCIRWPRV